MEETISFGKDGASPFYPENKYFGVVYLNNGSSAISMPFDTQEEALDYLKEYRDSDKFTPACICTTVIKRDMSRFPDGMIFGHPKSLNVLGNKR